MSQENPTTQMSSIVERVRLILLSPKAAWDVIDLEPYDLGKLLTGYVLILAAIAPIAWAVGAALFGFGALGFSYHPPLVSVLMGAVTQYVMAVVGVFLVAFLIDVLAPNFSGTKNFGQAMKVAAYSATASWVVGVVHIFPALSPLAILGGLYALYLLYLGLPRLMKSAPDKTLAYTALVIVLAIVLAIVGSLITLPFRGASLGAAGLGAAGLGAAGAMAAHEGRLEVNGANVDVGKLSAAAQQMQASAAMAAGAASGAATGAAAGVPAGVHYTPDQLKALLPASVAGAARSEVSAESAGAAGMGAVHARAEYATGSGGRITLELTDLGAMGALGAMAAAANVNSSKETSTGYEKVSTVGDRLVTESYDREAKSGKYSVLMGGKIAVQADGTGVSIDDLKAAVNAVGLDRLSAAAHGA